MILEESMVNALDLTNSAFRLAVELASIQGQSTSAAVKNVISIRFEGRRTLFGTAYLILKDRKHVLNLDNVVFVFIC